MKGGERPLRKDRQPYLPHMAVMKIKGRRRDEKCIVMHRVGGRWTLKLPEGASRKGPTPHLGPVQSKMAGMRDVSLRFGPRETEGYVTLIASLNHRMGAGGKVLPACLPSLWLPSFFLSTKPANWVRSCASQGTFARDAEFSEWPSSGSLFFSFQSMQQATWWYLAVLLLGSVGTCFLLWALWKKSRL